MNGIDANIRDDPAATGEGDGDQRGTAISPYAWYVIVVLMMMNILAHVDRVIPYVIAPLMAADLHLSDTQIGAIGTLSFTLVYSLAAIPLAWLADRVSRPAILGLSAMIWSSFTACGGLAQNFMQLVGSRVGLAIGEAVAQPAGASLIADHVPTARRRFALSMLYSAAPLGGILGSAGGGMAAQHFGWRPTLMVLAIPGVVVGLVILLTVREARGRAVGEDAEAPPPLGRLVAQLASDKVFRQLLISGILFFTASSAINSFTPTFLVRTYGASIGAIGVKVGLVQGVFGTAGMLLGALLVDKLAVRDPRWAVGVPAVGLLLAVPLYELAWRAPSAALAIMCLAPVSFLITTYMTPVLAVALELVQVRARTVTLSILNLGMNGVGGSCGGVIAGAISDALRPTHGKAALGMSLSIMALIQLWTVLHLCLAARAISQRPSEKTTQGGA